LKSKALFLHTNFYKKFRGRDMKKEKEQINGFLSKDTEFEGKLSFTGEVRIDGRYSGEIMAEGVLVVGESAFLEADIRAARLIISGEVHGNIIAGKKIEINSRGKVLGNISAPVLIIEEGGVFEGACKMPKNVAIEDEETEKKVAVLHKEPEKTNP
jgi:cytoskeletal protein CcmA (bactofilin family)